jgi:RHS repeat-associated protein
LRTANIIAALNFVGTPTFADVARHFGPAPIVRTLERPNADDERSFAVRLTKEASASEFLGLKIRLPGNVDPVRWRDDVSVLLHCYIGDRERAATPGLLNLTDGCREFSILATAPVTVEIPYRTGIAEEIDEAAVKVFRSETRTSFASIRPIESYADVENKKTVATLTQQSGHYIAGILKTIEKPDRAPRSLDQQSLASLNKANPLTGVPIIEKPKSNFMGDGRLSYPIDLPGTRGDFRPSVAIGYASKSGYGDLGEGWHLTVPEIVVETRWGVPVYDPEYETETYLFNGEQLVPEAGESLVGNTGDQLHLVAMPHRTTYLRPRKMGEARFVLRRDDGLWRFIRHGYSPSDYWWEGWQEKPGSGAPKVSYFGQAPGRVRDAIAGASNENGQVQPSRFALSIGPVTINPQPNSISKWSLAREVDAHRNTIDYDWQADCQPSQANDDGACATATAGALTSRNLLLRRILYTSNLATEEAVLRCRENPAAAGCDNEWALYEVLFGWRSPDGAYRRSNAKSGGLVVSGRLLERVDVRGRQLKSDRLGTQPLVWSCSRPFLRYNFVYKGEFDSTDTVPADVTERGSGRAFLKSIVKRVANREQIFWPRKDVPDTGCAYSSATGNDWEASYTTRFDYDLAPSRPWSESPKVEVNFDARSFGVVEAVRDQLFLGGDRRFGPVAPSMLGTTATSDASISFYAGLNVFNPGKTNSFGIKVNGSNRTGYREETLLLDVDGDGINDLLARSGDKSYTVYRGHIDASGHLKFSAGIPLPVPFDAFNREPFQTTTGFAAEAHLFGTFFGAMSSSSTALQDTYISDVNGDGKPDVVSNGTVFFNTSSAGNLSFSATQAGGFIDPRDRAGMSSADAAAALKTVQESLPSEFDSEDTPRVDPVRIWRAPFSGDVIVHGTVTYAPGVRPSDYDEEKNETDPKLRNLRLMDHRDGVLFTIERDRRRQWEGPGNVSRCFGIKFAKTDSAQSVDIQTPAAVPVPDITKAVPIVSCVENGRSGLPVLPALPPELGADKGLLVSVNAGDVIYFRAHVFDNAQDDVVQFSPSVDYVRLADDVSNSGSLELNHDIFYGVGASAANLGAGAVIASTSTLSSACSILTVVDTSGIQTQVDEAASGLCDPWGRSIVRYRGIEEQDPFTAGGGLLIAPFTGRMHFEGTMFKPDTVLGGQVAIRVLPPPPVPAANGQVSVADPGCAVDKWAVPNTRFQSQLRFGPAKGEYRVDADGGPLFVNRGDRICVFVRFLSPDTPNEVLVWPQDMSGFSWSKGGLAAVFDRRLLVVQLDRADRNPDDLLSPQDKTAAQAPLSECPPQSPADINVRIPAPGDNPNDPSTWTGIKVLPVHLRCLIVTDRHSVAPRSIGSAYQYSFAASAAAAGAPPQAQRLARRLTSIKLPSSSLACAADPSLKEYRLRLDVGTLNQTSPIRVDLDNRRPIAYRLRPKFGSKNVMVSVLKNGSREPVRARAFTIKSSASQVLPIDDDHLVDLLGSSQKIDDRNPAKFVNSQIARNLPASTTTNPPTPPDALTALYAEIREGDPVNNDDDGVRIYPIDRVGYSFCAPDAADVEIAAVTDNGGAPDDRFDGLMSSGACGPNACPISGVSVRLARRALPNTVGISSDVPIFVLRRLPIDPESYRGWGMLAVTSEFKEAMDGSEPTMPNDDGSIVEDLNRPLNKDRAEFADRLEKLPTVRDFNRLRSRMINRKGADVSPGVTSGDAVYNGPCGGTAAQQCIREKFLSQIRVHAMTGIYRAKTTQQPTDWTYCVDNGRSRPKSEGEQLAEQTKGEMDSLLRSRIGIDIDSPHLCYVGPDAGLWISQDFMSASRLGRKDRVNPVNEAVAAQVKELQSAVPDSSAGHLVHLLPRISKTTNEGSALSLWVGVSQSRTTSRSDADVFDLNGDGFPDQIAGNKAFLTDPAGRFRCLASEVWAARFPCVAGGPNNPADFGGAFSRSSSGDTSSLSVAFSSPKTFAAGAASAAGRIGAALSGGQASQAQASRDPALSPLSIGAEFTKGNSNRETDLVDLNGDGLPDLIDSSTANLNFGYAFLRNDIHGWADGLMKEDSAAVGLSAALGYGNDIHEYGGGLSASSSRSRQKRIMADINGDGLIDVVSLAGDTVTARLNTGFGFSGEQAIGRLNRPFDALGQGESDMLGANAYFTFSIPIYLVVWTIYIILNPGASFGASLNRQVVALRDVDADGLPDLMATGGLNVAGDLKMMFDNHSASTYKNPFGTHGLLTGAYFATNPESSLPRPTLGRANYQFSYALSAPSERDPQSRWVLSEIVSRDGVKFDDANGIQDRRTCFAYESGYFDRFERRFFGFSRVVTVEGCSTALADRRSVQLDSASKANLNGMANANSGQDSDQLVGVRRIDQTFANRSIYESGVLLSETVTDTSGPGIVAGSKSPTRVTENTYVLLDTGTSTRTRRECFALTVSDTAVSGGPPLMRPMLTAGDGGRIELPSVTRDDVIQSACRTLPEFDRESRRLTPILVQSLQTSTEGDAASLVTAMQFDVDNRARVVRACDLGRLKNPNGQAFTDDDLCAQTVYDDHIQLSFIHGATGGGTLAFDRRDRVREIIVRTGTDNARSRWRTATYDPATGDLLALCQFEDTSARNLCDGPADIPLGVSVLRSATRQKTAVRHYHYDAFGNLDRYVSPVSADGYFTLRTSSFDPFLRIVELGERTDYCQIGAVPTDQKDTCLAGSATALGRFEASSGDVDWRHAVATTQIDINKNAIHTDLDGNGRPTAAFVSWAGAWAEKRGDLAAPKPGANWGKLTAYTYRLGLSGGLPTSVARVTRFADASLYKKSGEKVFGTGRIALDTDYHFDHLARLVRTIAPGDVCVPGTETPAGAPCDATKSAMHVASGLVTQDVVDREVETFLPLAVGDFPPLATATAEIIPGEAQGSSVRSRATLDGFDRPLHIRLLDANSYAFRYEVAKGDNDVLRHRTITRDARCVPSAMDRDERGLTRAVHEFMNAGTGADFEAHAVGSSFDPSTKGAILSAGWVKDIDYANGSQQIVSCVQGEASVSPLPPGPVIQIPLRDPFADTATRRRRTTTIYTYDALNQLNSVQLPHPSAVAPGAPIGASPKTIRNAYDAFGRRIATDDPDRGFEFLSYDLISNLVCHRAGAGDQSSFTTRLSLFGAERSRTAPGPDRRRDGSDLCLPPETSVQGNVARVIRSDFLYDRPTKISYRFPAPIDGSRKDVVFQYGRADDLTENRAGRQIKVTDVAGTVATGRFHPLGMAEKLERTISNLARAPGGGLPADVGKLSTLESYDSWGMLRRSTLTGTFSGVRSDGSNDTHVGKTVAVSEAMRYRYSPAGQLTELKVGSPCRVLPDDTEDCTNVSSPIDVVSDAAFDERGNNLRLAFGNGVVTRGEFAPRSNRLISSSSRLGVPCVEFGPGDDCSTSAPPILFQNVSYSYDAAGLIMAYNNQPRYADCAALSAGRQCRNITREDAGIQGLLVTGSDNRFVYDERARLRSGQKTVSTFGRDDDYWAMDDREFAKSKRAEVKVAEAFAFTDSHLLSGIRRSIDRRFSGEAFAGTQTTIIRHSYASSRPTAPSRTNVTKPGRDEDQTYKRDDFGRLDKVNCTGCVATLVPGETTVEARRFVWDPDDTLAVVRRRVEPTEKQDTPAKRQSRYYADVQQSYGHSGDRVFKRWYSAVDRPSGPDPRKLVRETIYADERLTVTREPGEKPEALLHIFGGSTRLASKWIGGDGIFTYHAQLPTRSVSDVVYARGDDRTTARVHQQIEYAAFGELLVGREKTIAGATRDPSDRSRLTRPLYRFDAKEFDEETGLTYFGARHYDQRFGLWLSPDPILGSYLGGGPNGGVFSSKNLASYSFGWGNPANVIDSDGRAIHLLIGAGIGLVAGVAFEAGRQYIQQGGISDWSRVGTAALRGGAAGLLGAATGGASILAGAGVGASSNVLFGGLERAYHHDEQTLGAFAIDAIVGGLGGAAGPAFKQWRAQQAGELVGGEALSKSRFSYPGKGEYTSFDANRISKGAQNIVTNTTMEEVEQTLLESGYKKSPGELGRTFFDKGNKRFTLSPESGSGNPTLYRNIGGQQTGKIRLKIEVPE